MSEADRPLAARLIGTIDAGERGLFESAAGDPDFERAVCARMCGADGALFACVAAHECRRCSRLRRVAARVSSFRLMVRNDMQSESDESTW
jgi:hypothetical protein